MTATLIRISKQRNEKKLVEIKNLRNTAFSFYNPIVKMKKKNQNQLTCCNVHNNVNYYNLLICVCRCRTKNQNQWRRNNACEPWGDVLSRRRVYSSGRRRLTCDRVDQLRNIFIYFIITSDEQRGKSKRRDRRPSVDDKEGIVGAGQAGEFYFGSWRSGGCQQWSSIVEKCIIILNII